MSTTEKQQPGMAHALVWPESWEELQQATIAALREETKIPELNADESGDIGIRYGSALVWVRVNRKLPAIGLFSCALSHVDPTPALMHALNELNTHRRPATFYIYETTVMAATEVDCDPFYPPALLRALRFLAELVDEVDEDLSEHFGGRTAFDEARPSEDPDTVCHRAN